MFILSSLESEVEQILESKLTSSEGVIYNMRCGAYYLDCFLPLGCRQLGFPPKTALELKTRLVSGTVAEVARRAQAVTKSGEIDLVVLIYLEAEPGGDWGKRSPQNVRILSLGDLKALGIQTDTWQESSPTYEVRPDEERDRLLHNAMTCFHQGDISLFIGSGVGTDVGLPNWNVLLRRMVGEYNRKNPEEKYQYAALKSDSDKSKIVMARYLKSSLNNKTEEYVPILKRSLYRNYPEGKRSDVPPLIDAVRQMAVHSSVRRVITYNYDDLLEKAIGDERPYSSIDGRNRPSPGALPIYHIHGFVPQEDDASYEKNVILSEDEYHLLYKESYHWTNTEQLHALRNTTCFFIGLSLNDPNLRRLLDIANDIGTKDPPHYAFLEKKLYKEPEKAERLFRSMGVNVLWFEHRGEVQEMIRKIVDGET